MKRQLQNPMTLTAATKASVADVTAADVATHVQMTNMVVTSVGTGTLTVKDSTDATIDIKPAVTNGAIIPGNVLTIKAAVDYYDNGTTPVVSLRNTKTPTRSRHRQRPTA